MRKLKRHQTGITLVEFSIIGSLFLLLLFAILELAIYVYHLQSMNDISRRTARIAAVCVVNDPDIKPLALTEGTPPGFTADNIQFDYLDSTGSVILDPVNSHQNIRFVQARIINFNYGFTQLLNFLGDNGIVQVQDFKTVLPAESLGVLRSDDPDEKTDCLI
ncbi:TadE/TadG family type IV pilus assembly protein [Vibrio sp. B1FLJ16]|uniref:TadE/TadG family type IV pilus assembly protein n=1 Tax=Vibrio sp. B1FLJ16 TaxID=2751178 RepID=UPI0015F6EA98|nr:TadE/TadG family type IV pilus assembly protein [Vibrio sp. B1FLJ16]CAD7810980.1 TadE-like protein [Vibrio sp. B1FLJ16]CAE6914979.1 TadE-like protein [Vibrio sp. B1FLJ16]